MTMFWGEFTLYGVLTKQIFLICPKFEGKVASQSWKHCTQMQELVSNSGSGIGRGHMIKEN